MSEPFFTADGQPSEESIAILTSAYVEVLSEIRCDPFYWCGTPVIADKHDAMVEACRRSFGLDYHSNADARLVALCGAAMERGWSIYIEQVTPKVNLESVASLFDEDGNVKPEAIDKLGKKFKECVSSLSPTLLRSQSVMNLREEAMAAALEQAFGIETPGGPPRHIRDERLRRLADAAFVKCGF